MRDDLKTFLLSGEHTAQEIARHLVLTESKARALLKEDQAAIHCRKNDAGKNVFSLAPEGDTIRSAVMADAEGPTDLEALADGPPNDFEATEDELAQQATRQEIQEAKAPVQDPPAETPADTGSNSGATPCPLCQAKADQVQAGPEGTYLGAARTCSACKKTYNVFTKEEVKMAKDTTGTKRAAPLNPQYKINAKIAAAEQAGGKLVYQREGRTWLLTKRGVEPKQMTAVEFSTETAETIHKHLGFTPPPAAPKAEKPAKAAAPAKAEKPAKAAAPAKAAGGKANGSKGGKGGAAKGGAAKAPKQEKVDELVD